MTREEALEKLELPVDAASTQISETFQELYNEFQMRITNAPTEHQRKLYRQKLEELEGAYEVLNDGIELARGQEELPAVEEVDYQPEEQKAQEVMSAGKAMAMLGLDEGFTRTDLQAAYNGRLQECETGISNAINEGIAEAFRQTKDQLQEAMQLLEEYAQAQVEPEEVIPPAAPVEEQIEETPAQVDESSGLNELDVQEPESPTQKLSQEDNAANEVLPEEEVASPPLPKSKKSGKSYRIAIPVVLLILAVLTIIFKPWQLLVSEETKQQYALLLAKGDSLRNAGQLVKALAEYEEAKEVWEKKEIAERIDETAAMLLERDRRAEDEYRQAIAENTIKGIHAFMQEFGILYPAWKDSAESHLLNNFWSGVYDAREKDCTTCLGRRTSVLVEDDGSYYLFAQSTSTPQQSDAALVKVSASGEQLWVKQFEYGSWDNAVYLRETNDDHLLLLIYANSTKAVVVKLDKEGNTIWDTALEGNYALLFSPKIMINDQNEIFLYRNWDVFVTLFRLSPDGEIISDEQKRALFRSEVGESVLDENGNVLVVEDASIRSVSPEMEIKNADFSSPAGGKLTLNQVFPSGNSRYLVSGFQRDDDWNITPVYGFIKQDLTEPVIKLFPALTYINDIIQTSDGHLLAVGGLDQKASAVKFDETGELIWQWTADQTSHFDQVIEHASGRLVLTGTRGLPKDQKVYLVNLDANGETYHQLN